MAERQLCLHEGDDDVSGELDRALAQFDAQAFAERHGGHKESANKNSHEYLLVCPECGSDRLRWRHNPPKMAFVCWGCRKVSGDTVRLVQLMEKVSDFDAIGFILGTYVGGDAPTELTRTAIIARPPERLSLGRLPPMVWPNGVELLGLSPAHRRGHSYLWGRGLPPDVIARARIGLGRSGRLSDYVIFPVYMDGGLVYYQGRATWEPEGATKEERKRWEKLTNYRKTLNPINRENQAHAEDVLFGYDRARVEPHVVICEGPIDALKVGPHAVALLGKKASDAKIERLLRMHATRYTVYLDRGEEERAAAEALAKELSGFAPTFVAEPPAGFDPGKLSLEQNAIVIARARPIRMSGLRSNLRLK